MSLSLNRSPTYSHEDYLSFTTKLRAGITSIQAQQSKTFRIRKTGSAATELKLTLRAITDFERRIQRCLKTQRYFLTKMEPSSLFDIYRAAYSQGKYVDLTTYSRKLQRSSSHFKCKCELCSAKYKPPAIQARIIKRRTSATPN